MDKFRDVEPGTLVFCVDDDDYAGYLFMASCLGYAVVCLEETGYEGNFAGQMENMRLESGWYCGVEVLIFQEDQVYLNEKEAMRFCGED